MANPIVLRDVSREDVERVAGWILDTEVSEAWFGRYSYGDSAHLGYDPNKMVDASESEWDAVFHDPHSNPRREIFSIYTRIQDEHIGEAQIAVEEGIGDGQASVLIGRKDLWHQGYGTASTFTLLEHAFDEVGLYRVWVDVPEYNKPAVNMFSHIGFIHEGTLRKSRPHEGTRFDSVIMGMLIDEFQRLYPDGVESHMVNQGFRSSV